jgi:ATP-binding cassette subfamily F protein uup
VILISHDRDFLDRVVGSVIVPEGGGAWVEYAGGYSDMLSQRGADLRNKRPPRSPASPAIVPAAPRETRRTKARLSFHDQHALKTLPVRISELQSRLEILQRQIDDPSLYARDPKAFAELTASLANVQAELSASEEKWLELELLREEIESG